MPDLITILPPTNFIIFDSKGSSNFTDKRYGVNKYNGIFKTTILVHDQIST